ncbi:hypothetical protein KUV57_11205 [Epibacterium sp. DP7N7-1]|nr:hypothetical protein [Epibacterium sp. DP7N7-1]
MVDFRKLLSPKSREEIAVRKERAIEFQAKDPSGMASALIEASRALIDSGLYNTDPTYSYDEWALYRCIPALAKRLDPDLEMRVDEIPKSDEKRDPLTWIEDGDDQKLLSAIQSIIGNGSFARSRAGSKEVQAATEFLIENRDRGSALSVAIDTVCPGSYPKRTEANTRAPLPGVQLIATHGEYDKVLRYSEFEADLDDFYQALVLIRQGEELSDDDDRLVRGLRSWERMDFQSLSIQTWDGTVLREQSFAAEEEFSPSA